MKRTINTSELLTLFDKWLVPIDSHGALEVSLTRVVRCFISDESWDWAIDEAKLEDELKKRFTLKVELSESTAGAGDGEESYTDWTVVVG